MKIKLQVITLCYICLFCGGLKAQDVVSSDVKKLYALESAVKTLQKFKISGFIQTQYQYAETDADGNNFKLTNGANAYEQKNLDSFGRFGIRLGRFKLTYEEGIASGVVQLDITDKGISSDRNVVVFKDLYLNVKDPWLGTCAFRSGIFDRPFGHEVSYSSASLESPERSRIVQSLFPDEKDLGAMLTLQPSKTSALNFLKLDFGLFAGNGIKPQFTSRMDFIGRLSATKKIGNDIIIGGGVSAYLGGVFQNDSSVYVMNGNKFELRDKSGDNIGKYAKRQYIGFDAQFGMTTTAGLTQVRGEYIFGEHPGNAAGAYSFKFNIATGNALPMSGPVYIRKISGGYVILTQDLGKTPFTAVVKYDWYNPNTGVSGNDIAAAGSGTGTGDITKSNIGFGAYWRINSALKLTAYYDVVKNETTENLPNTTDANGKITKYGWASDRKDNVFTLRLQYKF